MAALQHHTEVVALRVSAGANADAAGEDNWTPLHIADAGVLTRGSCMVSCSVPLSPRWVSQETVQRTDPPWPRQGSNTHLADQVPRVRNNALNRRKLPVALASRLRQKPRFHRACSAIAMSSARRNTFSH